MHELILGGYVLVSLLILLVVLIQGGENVDITAAFGGVSQAAFGPRGTVSTLEKMTWVLGGIFLALSIMLSVWATKPQVNSVLQHAAKASQTSQAAPVKTPAGKSTPAPPPANPGQH